MKTPIKDLERRWLAATVAYEVYDDPIMPDADWDALTRELWKRKRELSPYFRHSVPIACLRSSTGSGVDWSRGVPFLYRDNHRL